MAGKTKYIVSSVQCYACLGKKELTFYRGYFYCEKCLKGRHKKVLKKDQEYAEQLRKHILGNKKIRMEDV